MSVKKGHRNDGFLKDHFVNSKPGFEPQTLELAALTSSIRIICQPSFCKHVRGLNMISELVKQDD